MEREPTQGLLTAHIGGGYDHPFFQVGGRLGVFIYSDLPSKVAQESQKFGNTVQGVGFASQFIFGFEGIMAHIDLSLSPSKNTRFNFGFDVLENLEAPQTFNQSQWISLSAHHRLNRNYGIDITFTDFFYRIGCCSRLFLHPLILDKPIV